MTTTLEDVERILAARAARTTRKPAKPAAAAYTMQSAPDTPDEVTAWMEARRRPDWKPRRRPVKPKLTLPRIALSDRHIVADYEYSFSFDRRKFTTPAASVEEFIDRHRDPKWKPKRRPAPATGLVLLTASERRREEKAVAAYVRSRV